ncbi:MAG: agmatinase [Deltaproteobacteria bacterium]|nr:agmatinase [Deltaproteobacteria bacterium]
MIHRNVTNFGGDEVQPVDFENADIVVLPVCYESAPSYGTGSGMGAYHVLEASVQLERIDEETLLDWGSFKIHTLPVLIPEGKPKEAVKQIKTAAESVIRRGKYLLCIGGDHAVSIGPILAACEAHPGLGVLQIDAHLDLRDRWNSSPYNHACVMRRVTEATDAPIVQVGIRAICREELGLIQDKRFTTFYAHGIDPLNNSWLERVVEALPEKVYMTIDLDGLDPSVVPGTGTPEPGGLSYRQLVDLIRAVGRKRRVIAADITELVKIKGFQVSEYTAARIATKLFVYHFNKPLENR